MLKRITILPLRNPKGPQSRVASRAMFLPRKPLLQLLQNSVPHQEKFLRRRSFVSLWLRCANTLWSAAPVPPNPEICRDSLIILTEQCWCKSTFTHSLPFCHLVFPCFQFGAGISFLATRKMNAFFTGAGCPGGGLVICRMVSFCL